MVKLSRYIFHSLVRSPTSSSMTPHWDIEIKLSHVAHVTDIHIECTYGGVQELHYGHRASQHIHTKSYKHTLCAHEQMYHHNQLPFFQLSNYTHAVHTSGVGTRGAMGGGNPLKISRLKIRTHSSPHAGWTRCKWQDKQVVRDDGTDTDQYIFHQRQQIIRWWQESNFLVSWYMVLINSFLSSRITHPFRFLLLSTENL